MIVHRQNSMKKFGGVKVSSLVRMETDGMSNFWFHVPNEQHLLEIRTHRFFFPSHNYNLSFSFLLKSGVLIIVTCFSFV